MINLNRSYIAMFSKNMVTCLANEKHLKLVVDFQFNSIYFTYLKQRGINN